jgi:hypothetical protein
MTLSATSRKTVSGIRLRITLYLGLSAPDAEQWIVESAGIYSDMQSYYRLKRRGRNSGARVSELCATARELTVDPEMPRESPVHYDPLHTSFSEQTEIELIWFDRNEIDLISELWKAERYTCIVQSMTAGDETIPATTAYAMSKLLATMREYTQGE